ncbi:MAG: PHP domain-containing protein, partial [Gemmatimonadaceae bacterium]
MTNSPSGVGGVGPFVDLHSHSTASDGSRAPADVIREAKRVGLSAIALTDHDTLDGIAEATRMGAELGVRVVAGVELSAVEGDVETHILGLHLSDTR